MRSTMGAPAALSLLASAALSLLALAGCAGDEPEPPYRWEEETVYEDRGRADGHYAKRPRDRGARGAIYSPRRGVFCDESVRSCYTGKGGHPGVTEQQFGEDAGRRLARRIEEEGKRGARGIFRPADGVLCDRLSEVCFDREGASLHETDREFGVDAASQLARRLDERRRGPGRRDGRIYSPRKGVSCDERVATCYVEDSAHRGHTRQQFGDEALRDLERRMEGGRERRDGIYRPDGGDAVCDRLSEVCYGRRGASAKLTRDEFGRDAAAALVERLE